jgi:DNA modification methylase
MSKTIKDYPIVELEIDEIKPDKTNPNEMTLEQERGLEKSIVNFGRLKHIVVDQDNILIDGFHRWEVEKANGTQRVKVIQVNVKNDIERKMMRETLNKLHGTYNKEKESSELLAIFQNQRLDELAELLGQPKQDLENLISRYNPDIKFERDEDDNSLQEAYETETFVTKGEVWQLGEEGNHYVKCGDNQTDLKDFIRDVKITQLNTDPPYGVNYSNSKALLSKNFDSFKGSGTHVKKQYEYDEVERDFIEMFDNIFKAIDFTDYNTIYIWCAGNNHLFEIKRAMDNNDIKMSQILVWEKNTFVPAQTDYLPKNEFCLYGWKGRHKFYSQTPDRTTSLNFNKPSKNELHPTMKPIEMIAQTIKDGTQEGEVVLDVFGGSGTTLMACQQTNRKCYTIELDPHYCSVIIRRWENYTGLKASKLNT